MLSLEGSFNMILDLLASTVLAFSGGNGTCKDIDKPYKQSTYVEYIEPLVKEFNLKTWVSCFSGDKVIFWNNVDNEIHEVDIDDDFEEIRDSLISVSEGQRLIAVGHSWGSWTQLKILKGYKGPNSYLFSLDAISRKHCMIFGPWDGCKKFPPDIPGNMVAENTLFWWNYYQTEDGILHSDQNEHAVNFKIDGVNHVELKYDPQIWQRLRDQIYNLLVYPN
jgi:hypothetical protein